MPTVGDSPLGTLEMTATRSRPLRTAALAAAVWMSAVAPCRADLASTCADLMKNPMFSAVAGKISNYANVGAAADRAIEATPIGELFVRNLAMCFDRYQREKHAAEAAPVFSRTV